ncbi:unnamed protein product [Linum trigynum]|uniref:Uncharacterized protein n=1 Tax=Linum trigynum TaxID=586398 RepID=A0AAV2EJE8_9ROSI
MDPREMRTARLRELELEAVEIEAASGTRIAVARERLRLATNELRRAVEQYMAGRPFFTVESMADYELARVLHGEGMTFKIRLYREALGSALFNDIKEILTSLDVEIAWDTDEPPLTLRQPYDHWAARND